MCRKTAAQNWKEYIKIQTFSNFIKDDVLRYRLSLEVMTLNPVCHNVETKEGAPLTVSGVAQVIFYSRQQG